MSEAPLVLVVDDDPSLLDSVVDVLNLSGYRTLTANDGIEALSSIKSSAPDIIVSDIMMPNMDGYEFYRAVRAETELTVIPFIFLSARGEQMDINKGYRAGVDFYLTKPFETDELILAITSRLKRSEEIQATLLEDVERTKRQLINLFSHELRSPLLVIQGATEILHSTHETMKKSTYSELLAMMHSGVRRFSHLVEDLLFIAYIDSGIPLNIIHGSFDSLYLKSILTTVLDKKRAKINEKNINVELDCDDDVYLPGHIEYLPEIIERLLDNAIKFSQFDGHVWITVFPSDDQVAVEVRDEGIGIALENQTQLFQLFRQIDRDKKEQQGIGCGLAIVHRLVEIHHGKIEVNSKLGRGSAFTVHFPRS